MEGQVVGEVCSQATGITSVQEAYWRFSGNALQTESVCQDKQLRDVSTTVAVDVKPETTSEMS